MPIRPRGDRWQVDVVFQGRRTQKQVDTEIEAARLEPILLKELQDKAAGKASKKWTLETAMVKTFTTVWNHGKSKKTHEKNSKLMMEYFGKGTFLSDIDSDWVDAWVTELEELGNSGSTINRKLACLSKVMTVAKDRGVISAKPKLSRRAEGEGRIRWLTFEEEDRLLGLFKSWSKNDHWDFAVVLVDTGLRPSEALRLTSQDIHLPTNLIHVWVSKNHSPRAIPMTKRVREIMERRTQGGSKPFPFTQGWFRNQWDRAKALMGLKDDKQFVPYALRHTCASRQAQAGVSIQALQKWMGHKTIKVTMGYAHLAPGALQAGLAALERDNIPSSG